MDAINAILASLSTTPNYAKSDVSSLFAELVTLLKPVQYDELKALMTKESTHKYLVDAMPLIGSPASFTIFKELYQAKEISDVEADIFFTSLAFVKYPTKDMLKELQVFIST